MLLLPCGGGRREQTRTHSRKRVGEEPGAFAARRPRASADLLVGDARKRAEVCAPQLELHVLQIEPNLISVDVDNRPNGVGL